MIAVLREIREPTSMRIPLLAVPLVSFLFSGVSLAVDFETEVWPFIEKKCVECHKAPYEQNGRTKKPKAGLRLDGAWAWTLGSENGKVLEAGKPDDSELYIRVTLPDDDDDFMPPVGDADPLTEAELALFKKWIEEGADFGGWSGNLEGKPKDMSNTGDEIPVSEIQELYSKLSEGLEKPDEKSWDPVTAAGGRVQRLASDSPLVAVDFRLTRDEATDEKIASAAVIADHVADLDLSRSQITDAGTEILKEMPRLVRLNLSKTGIGDSALDNLTGLKDLRYLNLYETKVTDAGLKKIAKLPNLEAVYLWGSGATKQGVKQLSNALPDAKISFK